MANIRCTAKKSPCGGFYTVEGEKKWITNGVWADYFTAGRRPRVRVSTCQPFIGSTQEALLSCGVHVVVPYGSVSLAARDLK